jgi:hypothetical protein
VLSQPPSASHHCAPSIYANGIPSPSRIQAILLVPHAAQELLSAEKTPTLSVALPAYELLLNSWLHLQTELPMLKHYIGVGIDKIQEYVDKGRKSRIYALAMSM